METERIAKLPKWAQQYVHKLERDVEWYKKQLQQTSSGESSITWEMGIHEVERRGIPERATVRFQLADGWIDCMLRKGVIQIHQGGGHRGRLVVGSQAYNMIEVYIVKEA